jgi:hypothetical protein
MRRALVIALAAASMMVCDGSPSAAPVPTGKVAEGSTKPSSMQKEIPDATTASRAAPTLTEVLDLLADHKRMSAISPPKIREQISWLTLAEEGKTESALVLGLPKPTGIVKKATFSFSATEDGKGWVLNSFGMTCSTSFSEAIGMMRKRLGKPKLSRKKATLWQFRDGWGISVTAGEGGDILISANPNEDISE